jgi:molybdate transport system substrate-binding protein
MRGIRQWVGKPITGVHGEIAKKALQDARLWDTLASRFVYAQDMAQVFQYATEGAVDAAFCPLTLTYTEKGKKGCFYEMNESPDVVYSACVLKRSKNLELVRRFAAHLVSSDAQRIKKKSVINRCLATTDSQEFLGYLS